MSLVNNVFNGLSKIVLCKNKANPQMYTNKNLNNHQFLGLGTQIPTPALSEKRSGLGLPHETSGRGYCLLSSSSNELGLLTMQTA